MYSIIDIQQTIPHRFPFLMIDRVLSIVLEQSVTIIKNVSINEHQFQGHFPQNPILPGVYLIEHLAQGACFLLGKSFPSKSAMYYLARVDRMTFSYPVSPGDQITSVVEIEKIVDKIVIVNAKSMVGDIVAAKGCIYLSRQE
jgi:3-hydroxyacyl-[acyl-carrier-protein] dehydratase